MGKSKSRRAVDIDDDNVTAPIPRRSVLESYLEELLNKKAPKREKGIESIVEVLSNSSFKSEVDFLENNFATFAYRCLNLFKKGSAKELKSSSQAIGLLAMIIDDKDDANEIYRDVIRVVSDAIKSGPKTLKVFDCLATSTFFGAANSEETQEAMRVIWTFLRPESGDGDHSPEALVAAISAWVFLLSSLQRWEISSKYWKGAIPYFSSLLENHDDVQSVAGEALAVIYETESVGKFVSSSSAAEEAKSSVKESIVEKLERLCLGKTKEQPLRVLDYLKNDLCQSISTDALVLSPLSKVIQLNYLKSFLGNRGFHAHILENKKLQATFDYSGENKAANCAPPKELYVPIIEEVTAHCYLPKERDFSGLIEIDKEIKQDKHMRRAVIDRAQTKLRNKKRVLARETKLAYSFDD